MNVFHFGTGTRRLFGLYLPAASQGPNVRAAVLCAPWGQEYLRSHRSLRQLAIQLNAAGFHVLRFDYYGTGDSSGEMVDATVKDWEDDVAQAVDEMRDTSGADRVSLVGLRFGATLAARVASTRPKDIRDLVLWDPVVSGASYLGELRCAAAASDPLAATARRDSVLQVHGFPLTPTVASELGALDLVPLADRLPAHTYSVTSSAERANEPAAAAFHAALERRGGGATAEVVEAPPAWIEYRGSGTSLMPVAILQRITEWLT